MYLPAKSVSVSGYRGVAVALLAELAEAERLAAASYDLNYHEFLPEGWHQRLKDLLETEAANIKGAAI